MLWLLVALWPLAVSAGPQAPQNVAVLVDPTGQETIDTVSAPQAAGRFMPLQHGLQAGDTRRVQWLRFTLPANEAGGWYLEVEAGFLDDVRLHERVGSSFLERPSGATLPRSTRDGDRSSVVFRLQPSGVQTHTVYLRLQTSSSSLARLTAWPPDAFLVEARQQARGDGLYIGAALMMALLALGLWLQLRERLFALFSLHALAHAFQQACATGWTAQSLLPGSPGLADFAVVLGVTLPLSTSMPLLLHLIGQPTRPDRTWRRMPWLTAWPWLLPAAHLLGVFNELAPAIVVICSILQSWLLWEGIRRPWTGRRNMPLLLGVLCLHLLHTMLRALATLSGAGLQVDGQWLPLAGSLLMLAMMLAAIQVRLRDLHSRRSQAASAARDARVHSAQVEQLFQADQVGRQALQNLLIEREAALAQLQQAQWLGTIGHWEWQPASGSLVCSDVVRQMLGSPSAPGRMHARDLQRRLSRASRQALRTAVRQALRSGEPFVLQLQLQLPLPSGQTRWLELHGRLVPSAGRSAPSLHGTLQDVSIRHLAQQAVMAQRNKDMALQAKNEFLARVSHEMRTPLTAVLGFTQLLAMSKQVQALPAATEQVEMIQGAASHLQAMIDDVLDLARLQAGGLTLALGPIPVAPLVDDCLAWLGTLAQQQQVGLLWTGADTSLQVQADRNRLRQVLLNLLRNAIQYNHIGGRVTISVQRAAPVAAADGQMPPTARLALAVHDTGPGLTETQIGALFTPFTRLAADAGRTEGAGLGLAVSRSLVEAMGGQLQVASVPGQGSTFTVLLPEALGSPVASRPPATADQPATDRSDARTAAVVADMTSVRGLAPGRALPEESARRHTVLYIDDNRLNRAVVRHAMRRLPQVRLELARNGAEGLAQARAVRPDLVLLDINLPDMDGLTVLQHLRQDALLAHVPCVAVSANALPRDIDQALDAGFRHYVTKPFEIQRLLDLVRRECGMDTARRG